MSTVSLISSERRKVEIRRYVDVRVHGHSHEGPVCESERLRLGDDTNRRMLHQLSSLREACERAAARFGLVPKSVVAGGYGAATYYENTVRTGETRPCHVRVYILGHERVGKTSLYRNLTGQEFRHNEARTAGAAMCDVEAHVVRDNWKVLDESQSNFKRVVVGQVAEQLRAFSSSDVAALLVVLLALVTGGASVCSLMPTGRLFVLALLLLSTLLVGWGMALALGPGIWFTILWSEIFVLSEADYAFDIVWYEPLVIGLFAIEMMGCLTGTVLGANFALGILLTCSLLGLSPGCLVQAGCFNSKGFKYFETVATQFAGGVSGVALSVVIPATSIKFGIIQLVVFPLITAGCITVLTNMIVLTYYPSLPKFSVLLVSGLLYGNSLRYCLAFGRYLSVLFAKLMGTWKKPRYMKTRVASLFVGMVLGGIIVHMARYIMMAVCPAGQISLKFPNSFQQFASHMIEPTIFVGVTLGHWLRNEPIASRPDANVPVQSIVDHMTASKVENLYNPLLKMIDFAGQRAYYAMHHIFLSAQGIFIVVFDFRKALTDFERHMGKLHFWISSVLALGKNESARLFFVGTHRDDTNLNCFKRQIIVRRMYAKFINFHPYICFNRGERDAELAFVFQIENSAECDDPAVCSLREQIIEEIRQKHDRIQQNPVRWLALEDEIIRLRSECLSSVLALQEIQNEAQKCDIKGEDFSNALSYLNESGVIFYSNTSSLKDYVIVNPQALIDALVALLTIPAPQNRGLHYTDWHRLENDGIASYELIKHAWRNLREPINVLIKFLQYYGIIYDITTDHSEQEFAVVSCLPCKLPSDAWNEVMNEDANERERKSIYVRFHDISDPHQAFFYVLLTKARMEADLALRSCCHFKVHWSRTGGVFAFYFPTYEVVVPYKLEFCEGMFKLTIQKCRYLVEGAVLRRLWEMLEDIRSNFFPSAEFDVGPACPFCSLPYKENMSQSLLLATQWGRYAFGQNGLHVLPLATSGQTGNRNDCDEDTAKQFERCPTLYCNTREVPLTHSNIERWLQISQTRPFVQRAAAQVWQAMNAGPLHSGGGEVVSDCVLELIADQLMSREWCRLARCLQLSEHDISDVKCKNRDGNLRGCCRDMLMLWKGKRGVDALGFIMAEALHKADLRQLADRHIQL